jgi:hypothetical protein
MIVGRSATGVISVVPALCARCAVDVLHGKRLADETQRSTIQTGEMSVGDEGAFGAGDVRWVRAGTFYGPEVAGADGCELLLISSGGPPGVEFERSTARAVGSVSGDA